MEVIDKMPRWMLVCLSLGCLILSSVWISSSDKIIHKASADNIDQEARIRILERTIERIDNKLERIGERLGVKA